MNKLRRAHESPCRQSGKCSAHDHVSSLATKLLLSVSEAAEVLGVSKRTVFLLLASGELTRRKIRRRTVIHRDDVIRFAAADRGDQTEPGD